MSDSQTSLPSPKIRFKELDVEFLQKQARIWLEAVVGERYDQSISLSSLLADGEILRKASSKIWEQIQKHGDKDLASNGPIFPEASSNGKHSGRYLPYSNIDTFLKICQKFGLTGVDLFSPPDVVEEKDIRRVCLCIRALSQKARARNIKVPNFDYVTHSAILPTEMVGGVKSLTNHLNAAISENKETTEKLLWNTPLLSKKSADHKSVNGLPHLSSAEIPKDKDCVSSSLVTEAGPKLNGKSYKTTIYAKGLPLSSPEEPSKSPNDAKVVSTKEENTVYYEGFRKKINRALFEDDKNLKQSFPINQELPYKPEAEEVLSNDASSNSDEDSDEISCTMNSISDTSKCASESTDEKQTFEQLVDMNPPAADKGEKRKVRKTWPVVTITMAVLGAVFIFRRGPKMYGRNGKDSLLQSSKEIEAKNLKTDIISPNESIELHP